MRLFILADTYVPARTSGALQLHDLAVEMLRQGHQSIVVAPSPELASPWLLESVEGVLVLRVRTLPTKEVSYLRRVLGEALLPWFFWRAIRRSNLLDAGADGVVWYSPTIFLGPVIRRLRKVLRAPSYLILRDVFPDWAVDAGVLRKGLAYWILKRVERSQYRQASVIGVQTQSNVDWVDQGWRARARVEVLHNWLTPKPLRASDQELIHPFGAERSVMVYAGNMGVAQDLGAFLELARRMRDRQDVVFLFVGRGSDMPRLQQESRELPNVAFVNEIAPERIPVLLSQCAVGIVALDPRHRTHNIPGKLLTYLHAGLPVLARVNAGNDLVGLVNEAGVGLAVEGDDPEVLEHAARRLTTDAGLRDHMADAGRNLAASMFSSDAAVKQIINVLREAHSAGTNG